MFHVIMTPVIRCAKGAWGSRTHSASLLVKANDGSGREYFVHCYRNWDRNTRVRLAIGAIGRATYETEISVNGRRIPDNQLTEYREYATKVFKTLVREYAERNA